MPINYNIYNQGHFIHATVTKPVSNEEMIEYELVHTSDERLKPPVVELLEIEHGALDSIEKEAFSKILEHRKKSESPHINHKCAIVPSVCDDHAWNLTQFYEQMVSLHSPKDVIIFSDIYTAKVWLGVESTELSPNNRVL